MILLFDGKIQIFEDSKKNLNIQWEAYEFS